ncbi:MAG TPA: hypothetical protein VME69_10975 [Methylocella sp.]|nr:hypothetical protein [Methylocella sp.]
MPNLSEGFLANKNYLFLFAALAFLASAILVVVISQLRTERRSRLPRNGRARVPRLGMVDAFDLDRQRQLVIIRRDNIEHLLMIGGPNDLLIESQIIRAESRDLRDVREAKLRDKEFREKEPQEIAPMAAGSPRAASGEAALSNPLHRKMPFSDADEAVTVPLSEDRDQAPPSVPSGQRPSIFPVLARRVTSPLPSQGSGQKTEMRREPQFIHSELSNRSDLRFKPFKEFSRASIATPFLRSSLSRRREGRGASSEGTASSMQAGVKAGPLSISSEEIALNVNDATAQGGEAPLLPLVMQDPQITTQADGQGPRSNEVYGPQTGRGPDLLEEEMAKLLGRG